MARPQMGDERREQILAAFEKCVMRKGLAKTTLVDVAEESGLPRSLVRYFVGNRADMVTLLIDRMIERGDDGVARLRPKDRALTTQDLVAFVFTDTFANDISNAVVGELWYLSERDTKVRKRLATMYERCVKMISTQMKIDGLGTSDTARNQLALTIVSLAYGHGSFRFLGIPDTDREAPLQHALQLINALPQQKTPRQSMSASTSAPTSTPVSTSSKENNS